MDLLKIILLGLGLVFRKSDEMEGGFDLFEQVLPCQSPLRSHLALTDRLAVGAISLHRADLLSIFLQNLPASCNVHTSKRLTHYTTEVGGTPITLYFADGSSASADVLIGADGVRSPTRKTLFEIRNEQTGVDSGASLSPSQISDPVWSGSLVYRCLVSVELLKTISPEHRAIHSRIIVSSSLNSNTSRIAEAPRLKYCGKDKASISNTYYDDAQNAETSSSTSFRTL